MKKTDVEKYMIFQLRHKPNSFKIEHDNNGYGKNKKVLYKGIDFKGLEYVSENSNNLKIIGVIFYETPIENYDNFPTRLLDSQTERKVYSVDEDKKLLRDKILKFESKYLEIKKVSCYQIVLVCYNLENNNMQMKVMSKI